VLGDPLQPNINIGTKLGTPHFHGHPARYELGHCSKNPAKKGVRLPQENLLDSMGNLVAAQWSVSKCRAGGWIGTKELTLRISQKFSSHLHSSSLIVKFSKPLNVAFVAAVLNACHQNGLTVRREQRR
jgi:hypothetical protein